MEKSTVYTKPSMTLIELFPEEGMLLILKTSKTGPSDNETTIDPDPEGGEWP